MSKKEELLRRIELLESLVNYQRLEIQLLWAACGKNRPAAPQLLLGQNEDAPQADRLVEALGAKPEPEATEFEHEVATEETSAPAPAPAPEPMAAPEPQEPAAPPAPAYDDFAARAYETATPETRASIDAFAAVEDKTREQVAGEWASSLKLDPEPVQPAPAPQPAPQPMAQPVQQPPAPALAPEPVYAPVAAPVQPEPAPVQQAPVAAAAPTPDPVQQPATDPAPASVPAPQAPVAQQPAPAPQPEQQAPSPVQQAAPVSVPTPQAVQAPAAPSSQPVQQAFAYQQAQPAAQAPAQQAAPVQQSAPAPAPVQPQTTIAPEPQRTQQFQPVQPQAPAPAPTPAPPAAQPIVAPQPVQQAAAPAPVQQAPAAPEPVQTAPEPQAPAAPANKFAGVNLAAAVPQLRAEDVADFAAELVSRHPAPAADDEVEKRFIEAVAASLVEDAPEQARTLNTLHVMLAQNEPQLQATFDPILRGQRFDIAKNAWVVDERMTEHPSIAPWRAYTGAGEYIRMQAREAAEAACREEMSR